MLWSATPWVNTQIYKKLKINHQNTNYFQYKPKILYLKYPKIKKYVEKLVISNV